MADLMAIRVLRSDDRYPVEDPPLPVTREAQAGPWKISVHFGPVPSDIVRIIAVYSVGRNYVLDYMLGNPGKPGITVAEHLRNRDEEIDTAVARYSLAGDWQDSASLYVTIVAGRQIPCPINMADYHPKYFWIPEAAIKRIIAKHRNEAEAMVGFGIARSTMGPPYRHSGGTHPECPKYVIAMAGMEPCPLAYIRSSAKGTVTRATWNETIARFENQPFELPRGAKLAEYKVIGQIGMWHLAAYNESDEFRRFMWSYIGMEVLISAIVSSGRQEFTDMLGASSRLGSEVVEELLWPPNSSDDDPNRSIRFRFALAAALLSPETAAADVVQFGKLNQFRNNIHGRMVPGAEAPAIEAFRLFEKYAILVAEYLGTDRSVNGIVD